MEIHRSTRKHGIDVTDILHAVEHALAIADLDDENTPRRVLVLGPDAAGNILELIVLQFDDGRDMVIHAMRMRSSYRDLLPRPPEPPR